MSLLLLRRSHHILNYDFGVDEQTVVFEDFLMTKTVDTYFLLHHPA